MQERGIITNMDLKVYMNSLKNNPRLTEDMLQLVEEDLRFGLTPKETEEYTGRKLDYPQMKVYSRCLRGGYEKEVLEVITREGLSGEQMAVALEFYEKGVPLPMIREVTQRSDQTAFTMKKLFANVMEKLGAAQEKADTQEAYAKELLAQIREVVAKIDFQEKRYDALNEKLEELQTAGQDTTAQNNLLSQLAEKDSLLEKQQNEINEARVALARLRNELDTAGKERLVLEKKMEEMKQQTDNRCEPEDSEANPVFPVEYQTAFVNKAGRIIQMLPAERREAKKDRSALTSLFSRICFKKRADIVKLVAEKGLEPKQLVQIRNAIEKGLTQQQLMVLINHQIPAEQMEEIINIAVFENRQKEEV
ncbi:MAG: hypothetical protein NC124_05505 [Clostridium sp.]|nr:hypothetical protein [Clostridium sp.]MCM1550064.1 hypothetical protein [Clostridium sp.]